MKPLIDSDILLHELGWSGQFRDKETGEDVLMDWDHVQHLLDEKIKHICEDVEATEPPLLFISDSEWLTEHDNRLNRFFGRKERKFVPTFRYERAKTKPYKGTRNNPKPYHFYNILVYLLSAYDCIVSRDGLEADDEMCIYQVQNKNTIICSRDKDLRICPGFHHSWECGKQRAIGPTETDRIGWLEKVKKKKKDKDGNIIEYEEVLGYGLSFFYYQMLTGDPADNIPGCPGVGSVGAYKLIQPLKTEKEMYECVKEQYKERAGERAKDLFFEQADLLWIIQERGKGYESPK